MPRQCAERQVPAIIPGERRHPFCRRMCCDIDPDQVSALQPNDDQGIQQVEANGRNNEQIHRGDVRRVVLQKRAPSLTPRSRALDHVLRDVRLRDIKPELEQLAVDARRSPQWILDGHLPDQRSQVYVDLRPPSKHSSAIIAFQSIRIGFSVHTTVHLFPSSVSLFDLKVGSRTRRNNL